MNENALSFPDLAERLLAQAERYAQDSLKLLPPTHSESATEAPDEAREQMRLRLQTHFLFPQLSEWQFGMVVALYWQRRTLSRLVNIPQKVLPESLRTQVERVTRHAEQSFMSMVRDIKTLIRYESLSPAQRILFEAGYVRIPFLDPSG